MFQSAIWKSVRSVLLKYHGTHIHILLQVRALRINLADLKCREKSGKIKVWFLCLMAEEKLTRLISQLQIRNQINLALK